MTDSMMKRSIDLPGLGGEIVAELVSNYFTKKRNTCEFIWTLKIELGCGDRRYNPGRANLKHAEVIQLISSLEKLHIKAYQLEELSFSGEYSESVGYNPQFVLFKNKDGKVCFEASISSGTFQFKRVLSKQDIEKTISILKEADTVGQQLIKEMKAVMKINHPGINDVDNEYVHGKMIPCRSSIGCLLPIISFLFLLCGIIIII